MSSSRYHWGLLVGPKKETSQVVPGMRYHAKNTPAGWRYEELEVNNVRTTVNLLARIVIAKVEDPERLATILRNLPVIQNNRAWRCNTWIQSARVQLANDGRAVGASQLDWEKVETAARRYVAQKTAAGRYKRGEDLLKPKPTLDLMENKETAA